MRPIFGAVRDTVLRRDEAGFRGEHDTVLRRDEAGFRGEHDTVLRWGEADFRGEGCAHEGNAVKKQNRPTSGKVPQ